MRLLPISKAFGVIPVIFAVGLLAVFSLFFLPKNATAPTVGFRDCVRKTNIVSVSTQTGYVCRLPDGTEAIKRTGADSDLPAVSFHTADDMISGSQTRHNEIITTREDFDALWQTLYGEIDLGQIPPKPKMETGYFDHSTVIALFAGLKSSGGHSIEPMMVWEEPDRIEIIVRETSPQGAAITAMTTPYSIFSIPNKQKPISFIHVTDGKQTKQPVPQTRY